MNKPIAVVMVTLYWWQWFVHFHDKFNFFLHFPVIYSMTPFIFNPLSPFSGCLIITLTKQLADIAAIIIIIIIKLPSTYSSYNPIITHYIPKTTVSIINSI